MNEQLNTLLKQYVVWPELQNDFQKNIHFANISMGQFMQEVNPLIDTTRSIDQQIAVFYLANERLSQSRLNSQDVLGAKELEDYKFYQNTLSTLSKELITYIIGCCVVEARHSQIFDNLRNYWKTFLYNHVSSEERKELVQADENGLPTKYDNIHKRLADTQLNRERIEILKDYPEGLAFLEHRFGRYKKYFQTLEEYEQFMNFGLHIKENIRSLMNSDRTSGYTAVCNQFLSGTISSFSLFDSLSYLKILFTEDQFESGFGGLPWANIVDHGLKFIKGELNAEMFIDQAFSLEHNNGNMFNKDFIFAATSNFELYYNQSLNSSTLSSDYISDYISDSLTHNRVNDSQTFNPAIDYILFTTVLLNAQHLGALKGLISLPTTLHKLRDNESHLSDIYSNINTKEVFSNLSLDDFKAHYQAMIICLDKLNFYLAPIHEQLKSIYPEVYTDLDYHSFDIKVLLKEISQRCHNGNLNDLNTILDQKNSFFDFINYFHNEHFNPNNKIAIQKDFAFHLYDLEDLPYKAFDKNIIGGKAWGLHNMYTLGIPVPKAKVFTTDCCFAYYQHNELFHSSLSDELTSFQSYLLHNNKPILCSIRSGAAISMPGMMDTILNVGIDDSNYDHFCETMGQNVVDKCINKFIELFCSSRLHIKIQFHSLDIHTNLTIFRNILTEHQLTHNSHSLFPLDKEAQIKESIIAVFESWNSPRAIAYRTEKGISHDLGTAAIVQQMVFGNLNENSCTGVVFSRDCLTGENKLVGEFLPKAQGEDVVSGSVTPFPIKQFKTFDLKSYNQLELIAKKLEQQTGQIQDIEFTVEDGQLYILQHRQAVCSPIAAVKMLADKSLNQKTLLKQIDPYTLQKSFSVLTKEEAYTKGLSANSGVMQGIVILSEEDMQKYQTKLEEQKLLNPNFGWIFYANLTSPEHMPLMNKTQAFITEQGGFTSHAAIIARSLNKPCIVGLGNKEANRFKSGDILTIDATQGKVWNNLLPLVDNNRLAKTAAKRLIQSTNIKISDINYKNFNDRLSNINNMKSWALNFPEAYYVKTNFIKKDKFLDMGQKIAMIIAAHQKYGYFFEQAVMDSSSESNHCSKIKKLKLN